jgi:DNA-binding ferritin-like protein (Dps family)
MAISLSIPCEGTMLPTKAALTNLFVQVANLPSVLQVEIEKLVREAALQAEDEARRRILEKIEPIQKRIEQVRSIIKSIEKILGNYPVSVSNPVYKGVSIPDKEWERRITALCQEYHLFIQAKIIEIISNVIPLTFTIPVLGISIDIIQLFSNPAYRAELKAQIVEKVDPLFSILPTAYQLYDGLKYGVNSKAIRAEIIFSYIMARLQNAALLIIYDAIAKLIDKFNTIWETLGLPPLPVLLTLDVQSIIQNAIDAQVQRIQNAPAELKNEIRKEIVKKLESIEIFGYSLLDLIGGDIEEFVTSYEEKIHRNIEAAQHFAEQWPMYLLKKFMAKINKFFKLIGLGALFQWFTMDFCKFLKLVGFPTTISFDFDVSFSGISVTKNLENNYVDPYPGVTGELPDPA